MASNAQYNHTAYAAPRSAPGPQSGQPFPGYNRTPLGGHALPGPPQYGYPTNPTQLYQASSPTQTQGFHQRAHVGFPAGYNFSQYTTPTVFTQAKQNVNAAQPIGRGNQKQPCAAKSSQHQILAQNQHAGLGHHVAHERITSASLPNIPPTDVLLDEAIINPADNFTIDYDTWAFLYEQPRVSSSSASGLRPTPESGQPFQDPNESRSSRSRQAQHPSNISTNTKTSNSSMPSTASVVDHQVNVHNVRHVHIYHNALGGAKSDGGIKSNHNCKIYMSCEVRQNNQRCGNCQSCQEYRKIQSAQDDSDCRQRSGSGKKRRTPIHDDAGTSIPAKKIALLATPPRESIAKPRKNKAYPHIDGYPRAEETLPSGLDTSTILLNYPNHFDGGHIVELQRLGMTWKEIIKTSERGGGLTAKDLQSRRSRYNYVQKRDNPKKRKVSETILTSGDDTGDSDRPPFTKKIKMPKRIGKNASDCTTSTLKGIITKANATKEALPTPPLSSYPSPAPSTGSPVSPRLSNSGAEMLRRQELIWDRLSRDFRDHVSQMDALEGTKKYRKQYKDYDRELRAYVDRQIDREEKIRKGLPVEDVFEAPPLKDPPYRQAQKPDETATGSMKGKTSLGKGVPTTIVTNTSTVVVDELSDADAEIDIDEGSQETATIKLQAQGTCSESVSDNAKQPTVAADTGSGPTERDGASSDATLENSYTVKGTNDRVDQLLAAYYKEEAAQKAKAGLQYKTNAYFPLHVELDTATEKRPSKENIPEDDDSEESDEDQKCDEDEESDTVPDERVSNDAVGARVAAVVYYGEESEESDEDEDDEEAHRRVVRNAARRAARAAGGAATAA